MLFSAEALLLHRGYELAIDKQTCSRVCVVGVYAKDHLTRISRHRPKEPIGSGPKRWAQRPVIGRRRSAVCGLAHWRREIVGSVDVRSPHTEVPLAGVSSPFETLRARRATVYRWIGYVSNLDVPRCQLAIGELAIISPTCVHALRPSAGARSV